MNPATPQYPGDDLKRAVELTGKIYKRKKLESFSRDEIMGFWGLEKITGRARVSIAALRHYGLMTKGANQSELTDLAQTLIETDSGSPEYLPALRKAALNPLVFHQIFTSYPNASDDELIRVLMVDNGLSPSGAKRCVVSYRNTLTFAELAGFEKPPETNADIGTIEEEVGRKATVFKGTQLKEIELPDTPPDFMQIPIVFGNGLVGNVVVPIEMSRADWNRFDRAIEGYKPENGDEI